MDANKIDMFFVSNGKKLPAEKIDIIREKLEQVDDSRYNVISSFEFKDPMVMLLISIFIGELGIDRFMLGDIPMGILKLLTGGVCGVLWIIDIIGITNKTKENNFIEFMKIL